MGFEVTKRNRALPLGNLNFWAWWRQKDKLTCLHREAVSERRCGQRRTQAEWDKSEQLVPSSFVKGLLPVPVSSSQSRRVSSVAVEMKEFTGSHLKAVLQPVAFFVPQELDISVVKHRDEVREMGTTGTQRVSGAPQIPLEMEWSTDFLPTRIYLYIKLSL